MRQRLLSLGLFMWYGVIAEIYLGLGIYQTVNDAPWWLSFSLYGYAVTFGYLAFTNINYPFLHP